MMTAVADGQVTPGPSATALNLFQLATLSAVAVFTRSHPEASRHLFLLPTIATIAGGVPVWKDAIDDLAACRVTSAVSATIAVTAEIALGDLSTAAIMAMVVRCTALAEGWAIRRGLRALSRPLDRQALPDQIVGALRSDRPARAPIERLANDLSRLLVIGGLIAAAMTLIATHDVRAAVAVVIVVGGGIASSAQSAVLNAIGRSRARGAMVSGGACLEALSVCDTVVLVSTAQVVLDELVVRAVYPAAGVSVHDVLIAAASAERPSDHPIGRAIVRAATEKRLVTREPDRFSRVGGCGIKARCGGDEILVGNASFISRSRTPAACEDGSSSIIFVARNGEYLGAIALARHPLPDVKRAMVGLKSLSVRTSLFTGEPRIATESVARELMVDDFEPDLGPAQRCQRVQDLTIRRRVAMLGDAREDALALEAATVGITMSTTPAAPWSAGVILGNKITSLVEIIRIARRTRRVILANIAGALLVDATGVALAAIGILSPLSALLVRAGTELAFLFNASRLSFG